jgi:hypothetical protein
LTASLPTLHRRALYRGRKGLAAARRLRRWAVTAKKINRIIDRLAAIQLDGFILPDHLPEA